MLSKIKNNLLRDFQKVYVDLVHAYGKDKADEILLHWVWELKDIILRKRDV